MFAAVASTFVGCETSNSKTTPEQALGSLRRSAEFEQVAPSTPKSVPPNLASTLGGRTTTVVSEEHADFHAFTRSLAEPIVAPEEDDDDLVHPEVVRAYVRGRAALAEGDAVEAVGYLSFAVKEGGGVSALRALAEAYDRANRSDLAARQRMSLQARGDATAHDLFSLGLYLRHNRRMGESITALAQAIQKLDNEIEFQLAIGMALIGVLQDAGREGEAIVSRSLLLRELESALVMRLVSAELVGEEWSALALSVADDRARVGDLGGALLAWRSLASRGMVDESVIRPRIVWALMMLGRPVAAQLVLAETTLGESDVELLEWARMEGVDLEPIASVLEARGRVDGEDLLLIRLLAAAAPLRATEALRTAAIRTTNPQIRADLVGIALDAGPDAAVGTAASIATTVESMRSVEQALIEGPHGPEELFIAAENIMAQDPTKSTFAARLFSTLGRPELAWSSTQFVLNQTPGDSLARVEAIRAAGMMHEPGLINQVPREPLDPYVEAQRIRSLAETEEYDTARVVADTTVAMFPEHPEVLEARGRLISANPAERGAAVEDLLRAIQFGRSDASTWLEALLQATLNGDPSTESALRRARNVVADAPNVDRLVEVQAAMNTGRLAQAEEILKELASIPELRDVVTTNLLEIWRRQGRFDAARTWLLIRSRRQPSVLTWRVGLMWVEHQLDRIEDGLEKLRVTTQTYHSGHDTQLLEEALGYAGYEDERAELRRRRVSAQPSGIGRELTLAEYDIAEDPALAIDRLRSVANSAATRSQWTRAILIAEGLPEEQRSEMLVELAQPIIEGKLPLDARVARVFLLHLQEAQRTELIREAVLARPSWRVSDDTWIRNAEELAQAGEYAAAADLVVLRTGGGTDGDLPSAAPLLRPLLGYALVANWEPSRLIQVFGTFQESGIDVAAALDGIAGSENSWLVDAAQTASMLGYEDTAIEFLEEAVVRDRFAPSAMNNLGYTLLVMDKNRTRAAEIVEEAYRIAPTSASELDTLGWLRYKQGLLDPKELDSAIKYIEESVRIRHLRRAGVPPEVLLHYGDALWRAGRKTEAQQAWNEIIEIRGGPGTEQQMIEIYAGWLKTNFGAQIVEPGDLWQNLEAQWLDKARARLSALAAGEEPPLEPTWAELDAREKTKKFEE